MKKKFVFCILVSLFFSFAIRASSVITDSVTSPNLAGKFQNGKRYMNIYLPDGYTASTDSFYPVVYLLHGAGGTYNSFLPYCKPIVDNLIQNNLIPKIMMVAVDGNAHNKWGSSWYTNSVIQGNYEDYIIRDLIPYVDAHYRTKADRKYRAIQGHSMGGYGTLKLGMKHSDLFGAFATHSGLTDFNTYIQDVIQYRVVNWAGDGLVAGMSAVFSPNVSKSDSIDMPYNSSRVVVDAVMNRWLTQDCYSLLDSYSSTLKTQAVYIDCGQQDEILFHSHAQRVSGKLTQLGVSHTYRPYAGDHCKPLDFGLKPADTPRLSTNPIYFGLQFIGNYFKGQVNSAIQKPRSSANPVNNRDRLSLKSTGTVTFGMRLQQQTVTEEFSILGKKMNDAQFPAGIRFSSN